MLSCFIKQLQRLSAAVSLFLFVCLKGCRALIALSVDNNIVPRRHPFIVHPPKCNPFFFISLSLSWVCFCFVFFVFLWGREMDTSSVKYIVQ